MKTILISNELMTMGGSSNLLWDDVSGIGGWWGILFLVVVAAIFYFGRQSYGPKLGLDAMISPQDEKCTTNVCLFIKLIIKFSSY